MTRRTKLTLGLFVTAACTALSVGAAFAQAAAPSNQVEEIIVTAERRETTLQKTPLSIVALSGESIERKGIDDISDLALYTPNLAINGSRGYGNNQPTFSIRGISGGGGATSERGVALYIDGIYVPRTSGSVFKVFDFERVEVLRGPQGTLFGRNSTGGAIRIFTKQPTDKLEGYVKGTVGNFDHHDITGMINIPVSDAVAIRAQAAYLNEDGYVERGTQKLGGSEDWLGRLQLKYEPNTKLRANLGFLYTKSKSDGNPAVFETFDMRPGLVQGNYADWLSDALVKAGQAPLATLNDPRIVKGGNKTADFCLLDDFNPDWDEACAQVNDNTYWQADANIVYQLTDDLKLTSTSGYAKLDHTGVTDWQLLGTERRPDDVQSKVFYQEVQLNAALFGGAVDLVTGGNYFRENSHQRSVVVNRKGTSTFSPVGGAENGNGDLGLIPSADTDTTQISDSYGFFGSGTWHVTDKANLTLGARYAHDKKAIEVTRYPTLLGDAFVPAPGTTSTTVNSDHAWKQIDWRATLDYNFTDAFMVYATASKAYRAGQYSVTVIAKIPGPDQSGDFIKPVDPEKVINYEVGARTRWANGRFQFNPTAFYMLWSNRQAARQVSCVAEGAAACPIGFRINVVNSGDVDVYGVEADSKLVLTSNLSLEGSFAITRYTVKDPIANSGPNLFPAQASPTFFVGANYMTDLPNGSNLGFNLNYSYTGTQATHPTEDSDSSYDLPSYGIVNGRVSWISPDHMLTATLFANNLLDKTYDTFATRFGGGFWDSGSGLGVAAPLRSARSGVRGRPREFGLTLQYNFE